MGALTECRALLRRYSQHRLSPIWQEPGLGLPFPTGTAWKPLSGANDFWTRRKQQRDADTDFWAVISFLASIPWKALFVFKGNSYGRSIFLFAVSSGPENRVVSWPDFPGQGYPIGQWDNSRVWCAVKKNGHWIKRSAGEKRCPFRVT